MFKKEKLSRNMEKFIQLMEQSKEEELKKPYMERDILPIETEPQLVVNCLTDLFLGEDWYVALPMGVR